MRRCASRRGLVALVAVAGLSSAACQKVDQANSKYTDPVKLEPVEGSDFQRLTVQPKVVEYAEIRTESVAGIVQFGGVSGSGRIPYGALMYAPDGATFVYTNPKPNTYIAAAVEVDYIEGDTVVLRSGPDKGTSVVTNGAAELWGMEFGVGK